MANAMTGRWKLLGLAVLVIACRRGGQSGTEGDSLVRCLEDEPRQAAFDRRLEPLGQSLSDLAATIGTTQTPGRWLATGAAPLSFELGPILSAQEVVWHDDRGSVCNWRLDVQSVTLRSPQDTFVLEAPASIIPGAPGNQPGVVRVEVSLAGLPEVYLAPAPWAPDATFAESWRTKAALERFGPTLGFPHSLVIYFDFQEGSQALVRAYAFADDRVIGVWDSDELAIPPGPPLTFTPSVQLAGDCVGAEPFQGEALEYTPFSSATEALEGMTGTWTRCLDHEASEHVGLRVLPDGSWQELSLDSGELVARRGFGHEGYLHLVDTSEINGRPGLFYVGLLPSSSRYTGTHASERALVFRSEHEFWPAAVYLPATLPVRAELPAHADGERAGVAGCESAESGIVSGFDELAAALTGEYVLCSGALGDGIARIRFGASSLELMDIDGSLVSAPTYELSTLNSPLFDLFVYAELGLRVASPERVQQLSVVASRHPRKLWIQIGEQSAIFSALP